MLKQNQTPQSFRQHCLWQIFSSSSFSSTFCFIFETFLLFVIREAASIFIFPRSHHPLMFENKIFLFARFHWIPCIVSVSVSDVAAFRACLVGWGQSFTHISLLVSSLHTTHITRCWTYVHTELAGDFFFLYFFRMPYHVRVLLPDIFTVEHSSHRCSKWFLGKVQKWQ